mmetsp:Transcript_10673/g.27441  ORF Transcript_10673/g.27441 Transcript_10673/m.27441 type:complete len:284 (+) Transcript_10673:422-1273(+)
MPAAGSSTIVAVCPSPIIPEASLAAPTSSLGATSRLKSTLSAVDDLHGVTGEGDLAISARKSGTASVSIGGTAGTSTGDGPSAPGVASLATGSVAALTGGGDSRGSAADDTFGAVSFCSASGSVGDTPSSSSTPSALKTMSTTSLLAIIVSSSFVFFPWHTSPLSWSTFIPIRIPLAHARPPGDDFVTTTADARDLIENSSLRPASFFNCTLIVSLPTPAPSSAAAATATCGGWTAVSASAGASVDVSPPAHAAKVTEGRSLAGAVRSATPFAACSTSSVPRA